MQGVFFVGRRIYKNMQKAVGAESWQTSASDEQAWNEMTSDSIIL